MSGAARGETPTLHLETEETKQAGQDRDIRWSKHGILMNVCGI